MSEADGWAIDPSPKGKNSEKPVDARLPPDIFHDPSLGALAQLVERLHGMQEVRSSTLLCSTTPDALAAMEW